MWRLDHVQVAIPQGSESQCDDFYVGVLGMTILAKPPALAARGGRWYRRGALQIHLGVDPSFHPATKAHPALLVDHYDEVIGRCRGAGVKVTDDVELAPTRRCYVADPVGNRLEIIDVESLAHSFDA